VPAAAVIPGPIAYIEVVAVKKFVVEVYLGCFDFSWPSWSGLLRAVPVMRVLADPGEWKACESFVTICAFCLPSTFLLAWHAHGSACQVPTRAILS
jgi:hypothetical protein